MLPPCCAAGSSSAAASRSTAFAPPADVYRGAVRHKVARQFLAEPGAATGDKDAFACQHVGAEGRQGHQHLSYAGLTPATAVTASFRGRYSANSWRPMMCFITSIDPPAILTMRASAYARAIGYSHM